MVSHRSSRLTSAGRENFENFLLFENFEISAKSDPINDHMVTMTLIISEC